MKNLEKNYKLKYLAEDIKLGDRNNQRATIFDGGKI